MNLFHRLRDALGLGEEYEEYYYDDEPDQLDSAYVNQAEPPTQRRTLSNLPNSLPNNLPKNVIGLPGLMMEVILMQPRSFEEIPDAVTALRERKAVILNLNLIDVDQAQRCADYVAGGAFAIDGHQRQIGENVFLFTPNFVQISNYSGGASGTEAASPPVAQPPVAQSPTTATHWTRGQPLEQREF